MAIYKYRRVITAGPNGTTLYFRNTETADALELAEVSGWHYVFAPDGVALPEQRAEIEWQSVTLTDDLKEQIKLTSRPCHLIADRMQSMIRGAYSAEDELYFARISGAVALGLYTFAAGEQDELAAYNGHIEAVRQWARDERAKIGL